MLSPCVCLGNRADVKYVVFIWVRDATRFGCCSQPQSIVNSYSLLNMALGTEEIEVESPQQMLQGCLGRQGACSHNSCNNTLRTVCIWDAQECLWGHRADQASTLLWTGDGKGLPGVIAELDYEGHLGSGCAPWHCFKQPESCKGYLKKLFMSYF